MPPVVPLVDPNSTVSLRSAASCTIFSRSGRGHSTIWMPSGRTSHSMARSMDRRTETVACTASGAASSPGTTATFTRGVPQSQAGADRGDQLDRAGIAGQVVVHPVHDVAEGQPRLRVGETHGAARARMAEAADPEHRGKGGGEPEAETEPRLDDDHPVGPVGLRGAGRVDGLGLEYADTIDLADQTGVHPGQ